MRAEMMKEMTDNKEMMMKNKYMSELIQNTKK